MPWIREFLLSVIGGGPNEKTEPVIAQVMDNLPNNEILLIGDGAYSIYAYLNKKAATTLKEAIHQGEELAQCRIKILKCHFTTTTLSQDGVERIILHVLDVDKEVEVGEPVNNVPPEVSFSVEIPKEVRVKTYPYCYCNKSMVSNMILMSINIFESEFATHVYGFRRVDGAYSLVDSPPQDPTPTNQSQANPPETQIEDKTPGAPRVYSLRSMKDQTGDGKSKEKKERRSTKETKEMKDPMVNEQRREVRKKTIITKRVGKKKEERTLSSQILSLSMEEEMVSEESILMDELDKLLQEGEAMADRHSTPVHQKENGMIVHDDCKASSLQSVHEKDDGEEDDDGNDGRLETSMDEEENEEVDIQMISLQNDDIKFESSSSEGEEREGEEEVKKNVEEEEVKEVMEEKEEVMEKIEMKEEERKEEEKTKVEIIEEVKEVMEEMEVEKENDEEVRMEEAKEKVEDEEVKEVIEEMKVEEVKEEVKMEEVKENVEEEEMEEETMEKEVEAEREDEMKKEQQNEEQNEEPKQQQVFAHQLLLLKRKDEDDEEESSSQSQQQQDQIQERLAYLKPLYEALGIQSDTIDIWKVRWKSGI